MAKILETATFFLVVLAAVAVAAEDYDVGGDMGWRRPTDPEFYNQWVVGKTFHVGDVLEFEFAEGMHEVSVVNQEGYENCNTENPLDLFQKSPVKYTLNTTGTHFFLCPVGDHCMMGQKLAVTVVGASAGGHTGPTTSAPAPTTHSTAPTTPGSATTTPSTTAMGPTAGASGEAPSSSSAGSLSVAGLLECVVLVTWCFF
ncbi:PREDICTED: umecyanin [Tarenaya hassleriana]|uniref:umecyanin n=1 Tax=Tarenaya hassleriana TaxID=28532 RepID=UPI00053C6417|nr:PREDICTED: umecyanin [Tarenaya hassleriana]